MSRIRILPEILSNKIAAGEVVERPASVVKELIENALDAESTRIDIEIKNGGRSLIEIADNGIGMNQDDALLALERYATSKIATDRDLFAIQTLGFRGEALPSIASVSRFRMVTRDATSPSGTQIDVTGGRIDKVSDVGAPVGTLISVRQLFFNTPARRKFLKTVNTEMGHIGDTVSAVAMGHPNIRIRLRHNDKSIKEWPAVADPVDRIADILGRNVRNRLRPINARAERIKLSGWIALPDLFRSTFQGIHLYVNGRVVRDRMIRHALLAAYTGRLMKGRFPLAVLFINVPPDEVDVNVHPTKHEVRFFQQRAVHDLVAATVSSTLKQSQAIPWKPKDRTIQPSAIAEEPAVYEPAQPSPPPGEPDLSLGLSPGLSWTLKPPHVGHAPIHDKAKSEGKNDRIETESPQTGSLLTEAVSHQYRIIGQFHGTYILCESVEGLIIIDQHAAHERIMFEDLKKRYDTGKGPIQRLLIPETIELNFTEADNLERIRPDLARMGLEIEPFGQNTFVVKAMPALLGGGEAAPLIREILEKISETGHTPKFDKALDESLILMACHGALRANQRLDVTEQQALLDQLMACDNPAHCPHGRPIWIEWSVEMLEKSFGRRA